MDKKQTVDQIIECLGGAKNVSSVTNCMTRLRVVVKSEKPVDEARLKGADKVLGLVHDRACAYEVVVGPGNSRQFADICHEMGMPAAAQAGGDWKENKAAIKAGQKESKLKSALKVLGDIFIPLIPGIIAAGLCAGFATLVAQLVPNYKDDTVWYLVWQFLTVINVSFMTYITAWAGYRAAERFGATPILGGMLGMITSLSNINDIATALGLFNADSPLQSVLRAGKGGVLAVICGVFILALVEKAIRKRMPASLDIVFTPLITLVVCVVPYVLVVMPIFGWISTGITWAFSVVCMSENAIVRIVSGYVASALFLPLVAAGMHHGLVALYTVQLQELGFVTLYPALAMAGAGQVGACIAIYAKAKKLGHKKLCSVIGGALPAGFLGVGEPLIYGVTLPMGTPFITAGLGAGFGGAFVMFCQVASTTWGPSGLLGFFVMTAGEGGAVQSLAMYGIGLAISYVMGYIITRVFIKDDQVAEALGGIELAAGANSATPGGDAAARGTASTIGGALTTLTEDGAAHENSSIVDGRVEENGQDANPTGNDAAESAGHDANATDSDFAELASGHVILKHGIEVECDIKSLVVADGALFPMSEIPDPVFAEGTLGPCFGVLPSNGNVYSPASGEVFNIADTGHSVIIAGDNGRNFLVHAGIDTVKLGGKPFTLHVKQGDHVEADQLLLEMDLVQVKHAGLSPMIIVIKMAE